MRYKIYLILFITVIFSSAPLLAQDSRYRVEVIVLTHLNHSEEPHEVLAISDYSNSIDFLTPVPESEETPAEENSGPPLEDASPELDGQTAEQPEEDPNAVVRVEEMSDTMADAWRRLRLSAPFRPLQYLSWEQGSSEPFPLLRLHDLDLLKTDDPWEDIRLSLDPETGETLAQEPSASELLPPPSLFYALDGTVSLVRKRFLHLYIDMQQREKALYPQPLEQDGLSLLSSSPEHSGILPTGAGEPSEPGRYQVFDFKQNRQVRTARLEYFDGPVLSLLAYITPVLPDEDENRSETR